MSMDVSIQKQINRDFYLNVAFQFSAGSLGILGASGCGKSMTLKCIVGVEKPNQGHIIVDNKTLYNDKEKVNVRIQDRQLGYLFQHYALFPRMTVMQNVVSGAKGQKKQGKQRAMEWLERFELKNLASRYPAQLSGGQQQRVALARMLMSEPKAIFLDEPFSALDTHLREQMQFQLINIMKEQRNIILVTHSRDEAYKLCDQLLLIDEGCVIGFGKTKELFKNPKTVSVAKLTGCKNISRIERINNQVVWAIDWGIALHTDRLILDGITHIGIRAHDFVPSTPANKENTMNINVQEKIENPFEWDIIFRHDITLKDVIWWQFSKYEKNQRPEKLYLPPEKLLLLQM